MTDSGRDEPVTRYLMYKVGLGSGDVDLGEDPASCGCGRTLTTTAAECLDYICRSSAKDATLLYACVMEAQGTGDKKQAISALERVLNRYDYSAPEGIHLPALLRYVINSSFDIIIDPCRTTARLLKSELLKDGVVDHGVMEQLCKVFEGGKLMLH
jgi:hypothetical protein